jgi:hypothetical protein
MPLFGDLYDVVFNRENEVLEMALKWGRVLLAAIMLTGTSVGYGAQYELRSPFAISCEARIDSKGGEYFFARDHKVKSDSDDNELICSLATIAEKTTKTPLSRYTSISSDAKPIDNFGDWSWLKELEKSASDLAKQVETDDEYNHCGSLCGTLPLKPFTKRYQNCEGILGSEHGLLKLSAPDDPHMSHCVAQIPRKFQKKVLAQCGIGLPCHMIGKMEGQGDEYVWISIDVVNKTAKAESHSFSGNGASLFAGSIKAFKFIQGEGNAPGVLFPLDAGNNFSLEMFCTRNLRQGTLALALAAVVERSSLVSPQAAKLLPRSYVRN